jgi:hypothetical protein
MAVPITSTLYPTRLSHCKKGRVYLVKMIEIWKGRDLKTDYCKLRDQGIIPSESRFQVCLPTPINVVMPFIDQVPGRTTDLI